MSDKNGYVNDPRSSLERSRRALDDSILFYRDGAPYDAPTRRQYDLDRARRAAQIIAQDLRHTEPRITNEDTPPNGVQAVELHKGRAWDRLRAAVGRLARILS